MSERKWDKMPEACKISDEMWEFTSTYLMDSNRRIRCQKARETLYQKLHQTSDVLADLVAEVILAYMSDKVPEGHASQDIKQLLCMGRTKKVSVRQNNGMNRARGLLSLSLARFFCFPPFSLFIFPLCSAGKSEHDRCWDERNSSHDTHAPGPNFPTTRPWLSLKEHSLRVPCA